MRKVKKVICELCGQEISASNYSKHLRRHQNHPETFLKKEIYRTDHEDLFCKFCGKECKNKNSLVQHELRCKENPNRNSDIVDTFKEYRKIHSAWNKGLTKETDERIREQSLKISNSLSGRKGRPHTELEKLKISESRKKYLSQHPDKVPYLINHSSKTSYPEQYFMNLFQEEGIQLTYHVQINKYELDFADVPRKIDIEIDGDQHFLDKRIAKSDLERDEYFRGLGWTVFRIRWSEYKKMDLLQKKEIISNIKRLVG